MYPDYHPYVPEQKPKRRLWLRIVIIAAIIVVAAGIAFVASMGVARLNADQGVKDELVTQNKRIRLTMLEDKTVAPQSIEKVKSTDTVNVRLKVSSDAKQYCIEASSRKEGDAIQYHMTGETPELQPEKGLCGDNAKAAPKPPETVTLGAVGAADASFTWDTLPDARSYILQCAASPDFSSPIEKRVTTETAQISTLSAATAYSCRVAAVNSAGTSEWSEVLVITTGTAIAVPKDLAISTVSSTSLSYSWAAVPGAHEYILEYATDPSFMQDVKHVTTSQTQGTITGLEVYKGYFFHVKALVGATTEQQAPYSDVVQGRTAQ